MELTITTPALLFPTVSLVLLAYTNRFLAVAALVRKLAGQYHEKKEKPLADQIRNLRLRLRLIRDMQMLSIFSIFLSVLCTCLPAGVFSFQWPAANRQIHFWGITPIPFSFTRAIAKGNSDFDSRPGHSAS